MRRELPVDACEDSVYLLELIELLPQTREIQSGEILCGGGRNIGGAGGVALGGRVRDEQRVAARCHCQERVHKVAVRQVKCKQSFIHFDFLQLALHTQWHPPRCPPPRKRQRQRLTPPEAKLEQVGSLLPPLVSCRAFLPLLAFFSSGGWWRCLGVVVIGRI